MRTHWRARAWLSTLLLGATTVAFGQDVGFGRSVVLAPTVDNHTNDYRVTVLVSDTQDVAPLVDPLLVNGWGIAASDTSPWRVANNGTGTSTVYTGDGTKVPLEPSVPGAPTGTVFNTSTHFQMEDGVPAALFVYRAARPVKGDRSVQVSEVRRRSITEDPAVKGQFPTGWLVTDAGINLPRLPSEWSPELSDFSVMFRNVRAPRIVEEDLSPGATRSVELPITGRSALSGSARWVGTIKPLTVTIALNGSTLATGTTYRVGSNRGGSYLKAQTTVGGLATMSVTNTSGVRAKVRIVFTAAAL
jgi:hypothetical protein